MRKARRKFISTCVNLGIARTVIFTTPTIALTQLVGCIGGGGDDKPAATPAPTPAPVSLKISSVSSTTPIALSALSLKTEGLDPSKPFSITLAPSVGTGSLSLPALRVSSDGTVVVPMPLHIDASTGETSTLVATVSVSQGGQTTAPVTVTVADLPQLSDLGTSVGQITRAFYSYQQLKIARSLNAQQALSSFSKDPIANAQLKANLSQSLKNTILARNDIDRIMVDPSTSFHVGAAPDGTAVNFNAQSVEIQDRIISQYLLAVTNNGANIPAVKASTKQPLSLAVVTPMNAILVAIGTGAGAVAFEAQQDTALNSKSSTADQILAGLTLTQTIVSVGATAVAIGAAVAGAPVVAAAAGAVATYAAIAGVTISGAAVANDIYTVSVSVRKAVNAYGTTDYQEAVNDLKSNGAQLATDTFVTAVAAYGLGGASAGAAATSTFKAIFETEAKDVALAGAALLVSTENLYVQKRIEADAAASQASLASLPANPPAGTGFATVQGLFNIVNNQGPILSGLTGVEIGDGTTKFTTLADQNGKYSAVIPVGVPTIDYQRMTITAYDPITSDPLSSLGVVNLGSLSANGVFTASTGSGVCRDTDAAHPDGDDPDCD